MIRFSNPDPFHPLLGKCFISFRMVVKEVINNLKLQLLPVARQDSGEFICQQDVPQCTVF